MRPDLVDASVVNGKGNDVDEDDEKTYENEMTLDAPTHQYFILIKQKQGWK